MTNEVAVRRTQICLCCSASWESKHDRGPLICSLCIQSLGHMYSGLAYVKCKEHDNVLDATLMCPPATMTNGPYVPLIARTRG